MSLKIENSNTEHPIGPPLFTDPILQHQFVEDGFIKLPSIINERMLEQLKDCFNRFGGQHQLAEGQFHHTTHHTKDWELIENVNISIQKTIRPALSGVLNDVSMLGAAFIIKTPGENTAFTPHQDWTLLDETRYYCVNLWIALEDITPHNGALRFLKGSHKIVRNLRMAPDYPPLFDKVMPLVYSHLTTVNLKAGEAVLFDAGVLHGSFANLSGKPRLSVILGLYSKDAPFRFYYNTQIGTPPIIDQYNLSPEDYMKFGNGERPNDMPPDASFEYKFPQISAEEFDKLYPTSFFDKVRRVLKG